MKQMMKTKIPRKLLILAFLVVGLVAVELDSSCYASAIPCNEAYLNYQNADNTYYSARLSYFNGSPTTCAQDCNGITDPTARANCESTCQTTRATAFYGAQLDLFEESEGTCAPEGLYYSCGQAAQAASTCSSLYDSSGLTDQEEIAAVIAQYQACREASKVDTCQ